MSRKHKNEELNKVIGINIKALRVKLGESQIDFAARFYISGQQLQKYETGQDSISAAKLWNMAKVTNHSINYFYDVIADILPMERKDISSTLRLVRAWNEINDKQRVSVLGILEVLPKSNIH